MATKKNKVSWTDLDPKQLHILGQKGWTLGDIAAFYGIPYSTLQSWMERYPSIGDAVNQGILESCDRVERALFEKAVGYQHPDTKVMTRALGNNQGSEIVQIEVTKHYPPDTSACIFYLTNKKRNEWKHRMELQTDNGLTRLPDMSGLSFQDVMQLAYGSSVTEVAKKKPNKRQQAELKKKVEEEEKKSRLSKTTSKKTKSRKEG